MFLLIQYVGYDWLIIGLTRLLVIIAVLQLVKKVPDLINTIFGTHIKTQGGIKGRLGEMAGIGALAQKAWTSLGTGAKNLAKLGLAAPVVGAALGANALYKSKHRGTSFTDSKAGRLIRGGGAFLSNGMKTGNWMKAKDAAIAEYDKTSSTPLDKARKTQLINNQIDDITTIKEGDKAGNSVVNETNIEGKTTAKRMLGENISSRGGAKIYKANEKYQNRIQAAGFAQAISKNMAAVLEANEETAKHFEQAGRYELAERIRTANEAFKADGNTESMKNFILDNIKLYDKTIANNLIGTNGKLISIDRQREYVLDGNRFDLTQNDLKNFGLGEAAINFLANTTLKGKVDSAKADLDIEIAGAKLSEMDKMAVEKYISAETDVGNSMAFAVGRNNDENGMTSTYTGYSKDDLSAMGVGTQTPGSDSYRQAQEEAQRQAEEQARQRVQQQIEAIENEISTLNSENDSLSNELRDSFVDGSENAAKRRDDIRNRRREINSRIKELEEQRNNIE